MTPHYVDDSVTLYAGDCLDVLRELPDDSVDSVVTDPPYDLTNRTVDVKGCVDCGRTLGGRDGSPDACPRCGGELTYQRSQQGRGFMGKAWDGTGIAFRPDVWIECLRVLKPGGHLLAFGGTRTWHRLTCAIEDAGFEIRDSIAWLYGSGFPKSLDVSKAIDKAAGVERTEVVGKGWHASTRGAEGVTMGRFVEEYEPGTAGLTRDILGPATPDAQKWSGWGTALKPAFEPVVVARKPLTGTVAANVLTHGTGALNIDATRVEGEADRPTGLKKDGSRSQRVGHEGWDRPWKNDERADRVVGDGERVTSAGRWPSNVVLDESQAAELDRQSGFSSSRSRIGARTGKDTGTFGAYAGQAEVEMGHDDAGGASRFFPTFKYEPKAPTTERPRHDTTAHPTVKPLDLMRWLVRLVTPPGGTVLEPFAGSGTTAEACVIEGFQCIAIEREESYLPLIVQRLTKPIQVTLL